MVRLSFYNLIIVIIKMGYEDKSQDVIIKDLHKEFYKIDKV
jgi:hypothetical protein